MKRGRYGSARDLDNGVTANRANHPADACTVTGVADAGAPAVLAIGLDLPPEAGTGYVAP